MILLQLNIQTNYTYNTAINSRITGSHADTLQNYGDVVNWLQYSLPMIGEYKAVNTNEEIGYFIYDANYVFGE